MALIILWLVPFYLKFAEKSEAHKSLVCGHNCSQSR